MIDFDTAEKLVAPILGFAGGLLIYLGKKHGRESDGDAEEEANFHFIQAQIDKLETERDAANKSREEVSIRAVENLTTLTDIVRRLCYMLAYSECPNADRDKREIMSVIKYRQFDLKDVLAQELLDVFGFADQEIVPAEPVMIKAITTK